MDAQDHRGSIAGDPRGAAEDAPTGRTVGDRGGAGATPPPSLEDFTTSPQRAGERDSTEGDAHSFVSLYCANCGNKKKVKMRCKGRTCPECRRGDYFRLYGEYKDAVRGMVAPKFLTLTVPNVWDLAKEAVLKVRKAFRRMMRWVYYRAHVRGGLCAIEITNIGNGWHIHLHIIIDADFLPQRKLSADWNKVAGGRMVDIRPRDPVTILGYTLKYVGKAPDIYRVDGGKGMKRYCDPTERWSREQTYNAALKGIRMMQPFGTMYGKLNPEKKVLTCEACGGVEWISEWGLQLILEDAVEIRPVAKAPPTQEDFYGDTLRYWHAGCLRYV